MEELKVLYLYPDMRELYGDQGNIHILKHAPFYSYKRIYYGASLDGQAPTANNRLNAIRREAYAKNKEKINAQKRAAYQKRKELNSSQAEEMDV